MMAPESTSYWLEHSERITVIFWALIATTKRVVTQAQRFLAAKIKAQYCITDYTDDKSVLNNFALWLQAVHGKTASQVYEESVKLAPPTRGAGLCRW